MNNKKGYEVVKYLPFNWIRDYKYADKREEYLYYIYVGNGIKDDTFYFDPDKKILSLSTTNDKYLFYAETFEEAGKIVESYVKGNNIDFSNSIYKD